MNIQEREQLTRFLEQLAQAQAAQKDGEADALIRSTCARQADAAYLLVQRAMLLDAVVRSSQDEIARLKAELEQAQSQFQPQSRTAFIDANAWGNSPTLRPTPPMPPATTISQAPPPLATPAAVPSAVPTASAWGSGMLGSIATTAAGVVAGGFLFQGIEHLLGNQHPPSSPANRLSEPAPVPNDAAAFVDQQDGGSDIFDTSSVDDYIAGDDNA